MKLTSCVVRPLSSPYTWTYPCLGARKKDYNSYLIVLFYAVKSGVIMGSESNAFKVGANSCHWDMDQFEPFYGSVVISSNVDGARGAD